MRTVKDWLFDTCKLDEVPIREMNLIVDQANNNDVGIRAGGMFSLNYGIIFQVLPVSNTLPN